MKRIKCIVPLYFAMVICMPIYSYNDLVLCFIIDQSEIVQDVCMFVRANSMEKSFGEMLIE